MTKSGPNVTATPDVFVVSGEIGELGGAYALTHKDCEFESSNRHPKSVRWAPASRRSTLLVHLPPPRGLGE